MQPVAYLGMLFFISASALAAPHHHHNHLQRHRDRVATHAHVKHDHAMLAKRAEQIKVDSSNAAQAETQGSSADEQPRQSPSEEGPIVTLWEQPTGPKTVVAGGEQVVIRSSEPVAARGDMVYGRSKIAAHGDVGLEHTVEGLNSRHMNAATRLLLAHTASKHR